MKINISAIENQVAISEVQSSAGAKVVGGQTNVSFSYIGTTTGDGSGQSLEVNGGDTNSGGSSLDVKWLAWAS